MQDQPICAEHATIELDGCKQAWQASIAAGTPAAAAATASARVDVRQRRVTLVAPDRTADAIARALIVARLQDELPADVRIGFASDSAETGHERESTSDCDRICAAAWLAVRREPALAAVVTGARVWIGESAIELTLRADPAIALAKHLDARIEAAYEDLWGRRVRVEIARTQHKEAVSEFRDQVLREVTSDAAAWSQAGAEQAALPGAERAQATGLQGQASTLVRSPARARERARKSATEMAIADIRDECKSATVRGAVFAFEARDLQSGRRLLRFGVTDRRDSLLCKAFVGDDERDRRLLAIADGVHALFTGSIAYDTYEKDLVMTVRDAVIVEPDPVADQAPRKRVELHAHTQMSAHDGIVAPADLVMRAAAYGHEAVAITDHAVVQAFPQAYAAGRKHGVKIIYGVEFNVYDDLSPIVRRPTSQALDESTEYV
ncbi:MAG: PHP domain-containing protein, partial [Firmicutes bacterium]|nr:PHP domain-containing protein [Bacillota bacterium]